MGPYALEVSLYYYGGFPTHIGIGLSGDASFGFYPMERTAALALGKTVPGRFSLMRFVKAKVRMQPLFYR